MKTELKCRYCGGTILLKDETMGCCDSCGSVVALPRINKRVTEDLYNRADHLRRIHDYDGAISAYEHIIAENPEDPEARWNLVLCRYGVEYTHDRRTGAYIPSINRMSLDSILEDRDYLKALEFSQGEQKEEYRHQALKLATIQDELEKIVRENQKYDVFISFKATDDQRKRTRDYTLAQEIYNALSAAGLRVFFSPVSLREHVGEMYEPYIFAALYSSKVMVLVGTKREYLDSEWVKNEWSRYLFMVRSNPQKHILPVCEGMKPEEFPAEIGKMQAISMNVVGALELIKTRVSDYMGTEKRIFVKRADGEQVDLTSRLRRLTFIIEDGDFEDAAKRLQALRDEAEGKLPEIEYPALLIKYRAKNEEELSLHTEQLQQDPDHLWLLENGTKEQKALLSSLPEREKAVRQKQLEDDLIRRLLELYRSDNGQEIVKIIESERRSGTVFEREDEISELYRRAKEKSASQELLRSYQNTVGDGKSFFEDRLNEKHPQIAQELKTLSSWDHSLYPAGGIASLAELGGVAGLAALALWLVLKHRMINPIFFFEIALYILYFIHYKKSPKETPHFILVKSLVISIALLVGSNFLGMNVSRTLYEILGRIFGDGTKDDGVMALFALVPLLFMIRWGFRLMKKANTAKAARKKNAVRWLELMKFLEQFEKEEEQLINDEYESVDKKYYVPLVSYRKRLGEK